MIATNSYVVKLFSTIKAFYHDAFINKRICKKNAKLTKMRLKTIGGGYNGSKEEYRRIVLKYWKKYKKKPEKCWYDLYCVGMKSYDPRFIPNSFWLLYILTYYNHNQAWYWYTDKGLYNRFLPGIKKPETVVKRIRDCYYNGDRDIMITEDMAKRLILQEEQLIIKPTQDTFGGQGIVFYDRGEAESFDIDYVLRSFDKGFVAQRIIKQHPDLARINKDSVNTIRVITFRFMGEYHVLSTILRMGRSGSRVDNTTAGGCACPIKPDGWLVEKAVNRKTEWMDRHESSGILFKDIRVPSFGRILEIAKEAHSKMPLFDLIGWDFAVDENGDPVMIEYNLMPEQNQISGGPTFGDLTDDVLDDVFIKKTKR